MRIVITGSSGLIGSRLTPELAQRGHQVWAVSRSFGSPMPGVQPVDADLSLPSVPAGLPDIADVVVHLAQSAHYQEFPQRALDVFEVNVGSTARLLDWSRRAGVRQFILASSGGVAAAATSPSYYLASKHAAELLANAYRAQFEVLVLRCFFVYGRGQKPWMLVPRLIQSIRSGEPVRLAGVDGPRLNPVHVADAVRALTVAIAGRIGGCIDVAGPEVLSVRRMSETIAARLGTVARFRHEGDSAADLLGDIARMSESLAGPRCSFAEGVQEMLGTMPAS